jgi:hypothetical protein
MAGELLRPDTHNLISSPTILLMIHGLTPLDSNSPPPTSSPLQTEEHHNDTTMLDSPAETPDRNTARSSVASALYSEGNTATNIAAGASGANKGSKGEKEKGPFGAPGSCWKNAKYREEVARWEALLVHQDWNMSMFSPQAFELEGFENENLCGEADH